MMISRINTDERDFRRKPWVSTMYFAYMAGCLMLSQPVLANESTDWVMLVESDDSVCLAHGGKLISLSLTAVAPPSAIEVWVDRWFMQVQTADHTRHLLSTEQPSQELGCSQSLVGPQHWTLSNIRSLPSE